MAVSQPALANPEGAHVVAGDVEVNQVDEHNLEVRNDSHRAIVDWDSFSIAEGETTNFIQITNDAAILNRVVGPNMSEIYGTIRSNGLVYLINQNGIMIGASGLVDTNGFLASTLNASNTDFLNAGDVVFTRGIDAGAGIAVHGRIRSVQGGDIFLISENISLGTSSSIDTAGAVGLAAGSRILLRDSDLGNGRISVLAGPGSAGDANAVASVAAQLAASGGNAYSLAINSEGLTRAGEAIIEGGRVLLVEQGAGRRGAQTEITTQQTSADLRAPVIEMPAGAAASTGNASIISNGSITSGTGVELRSSGSVEQGGSITARNGVQGEDVVIEGDNVALTSTASIDVSAANGGGRVFVGGAFQGGDSDSQGVSAGFSRNARDVRVEAGASINADATENGDGGEVVVWSDEDTHFAGDITARGGAQSGDGGNVEVSGKENLIFRGDVDTSAEHGAMGNLLLDPTDIVIANAADGASANDPDLTADNEVLSGDGAGTYTISDETIENLLATNNVTLQATNDISADAGVSIVWTNNTVLDDPLTTTVDESSNTNSLLTLDAGNDINMLDDVTIQNYGTLHPTMPDSLATDEGGVHFIAGHDINIGSAGPRTGGVAIGSEYGQTTLEAGNDITVFGGEPDAGTETYALVGYELGATRGGAGGDDVANGTISVTAGNDITLAGGKDPDDNGAIGFAQIGHGGLTSIADTDTSLTVQSVISNITVEAGNDISIDGGDEGASSAVIGHGAFMVGSSAGAFSATAGDLSGDVSVTAGNDLNINTNFAAENDGEDDLTLARIGHGNNLIHDGSNVVDTDGSSLNVTTGNIQGDIAVDVTGALTVGSAVSANAGEDRFRIISTIGHGALVDAQGTVDGIIQNGGIHGFDPGVADLEAGSSNIDVRAGSVSLIADESVRNSASTAGHFVDNLQRSQIGHSPTTLIDAAGALRNDDDASSLTVLENRLRSGGVQGNITVTDTDNTDGAGISLSSQISGTNIAITNDMMVSRIGHAGLTDIVGAAGDEGVDAIDIQINQLQISNAAITVDTLTQGTSDTADDAVEGDDQDITLTTATSAALARVADNTTVAQIGHSGDLAVTTGRGGDAVQDTDTDAGGGGDLTILLGSIWDGGFGLADNPDAGDGIVSPGSVDVNVISSNQVTLTADTAAALASAERNANNSHIGHGHEVRAVTGAGGDGGATGRNGGDGGGILVTQRSTDGADPETGDIVDREFWINGAVVSDTATGMRGDVNISAISLTDNALGLEASDSSALARTEFNRDVSQLGHSDTLELATGNGGAGGGSGAGGADDTDTNGDELITSPLDGAETIDQQVEAHGGHGGAIIANLSDTLIEGDITANIVGRVALDTSVNNALSPAQHALVEAVIGHGQQIFADSGDGGAGGKANHNGGAVPVATGVAITDASILTLDPTVDRGSNRGGNGGDIAITAATITGREVTGGAITHESDADSLNGSDIVLNIRDEDADGNAVAEADSLLITATINAGLGEGPGGDVVSTVGHHMRLFAEGGSGGAGGSTNTEFDDDGNSVYVDGTNQTDSQDADLEVAGNQDGVDETALQAGGVRIQPDSSGGRGGDVSVISQNIHGNIAVVADRRVSVQTLAGHSDHSKVTASIGHSVDAVAVTQAGGKAGNLYEPPAAGATYDGGIINVNGTQTGANEAGGEFEYVLIDGNQDDEFNLDGNGDAHSTEGKDGIAVTPDDIANRRGSTIQSINDSLGTLEGTGTNNADGAEIYAGGTVIFHDEEADPQFILDTDGNFVLNSESNNELYAESPNNLERFGRVVATYDGAQTQPVDELFDATQGPGTVGVSLQVFVDMDQDGDVDLVDFDRDGRLDVVDLDHDGYLDVIDGRANYVTTGTVNGISGLGVLDYAAVTGVGFDANDLEGGWNLADFSTANGGRGGDATSMSGTISGDISVSTGDNDMGEPTSLVVSTNVTDDPTSSGGYDYHRAVIGHNSFQVADTSATYADYRSGRERVDGSTDVHGSADGGDAGRFAVNGIGGRGGDATVIQGAARDAMAGDGEVLERDHLIGDIYINTPNYLDNTVSNDAGRIDLTSFVDSDYGNNVSIAALGHTAEGFATAANSGGKGVSEPGTGVDNSQTEIADGGRGGHGSVDQMQIRGDVTVMTGADDLDGTSDYSLVVNAENGASPVPPGPENTIIAQIGHGRRAVATGGKGGDGDDGQLSGNGGDGGDATITQIGILDANVLIDLVAFDATEGTSDAEGYFGNGMSLTASVFENSDNIVRAQVGHGDLAEAVAGNAGDGSPDWQVNEQRNQSANGGRGGDATINQYGYQNDITLDIGHNSLGDPALNVVSSAANVLTGADNHILAAIGHGGMGEARSGKGGQGGLEAPVNSIQTDTDPNLVDADYNYYGDQEPGDTAYAIDTSNRFTMGTDRRGGDAGDATVNLNINGTGMTLAGRSELEYGQDDDDGATITVHTNDMLVEGEDPAPGYDAIYIASIAGPGSNQNSVLDHNTALVGHHSFGSATGAAGGDGIQSSLSATISEGDGGDGGTGVTTIGAIRGDVTLTNLGNPLSDDLDDSGDDKATNITIEALGGTPSDSINHRAEARVGHLTHAEAFGGTGGNASHEAGAPPSFPAVISAQGGDGGDGLTYQGQLAGDISITAENSVIVNAADGVPAPNMTVGAVGHRMQADAGAGDGGWGGTSAPESNTESIYFIYEALREYHARGGDLAAMSDFEQKLIAPVLDYFENKPYELEVFLDKLVGDSAGSIAGNARDDNYVDMGDGPTDFSIPAITEGTVHIPGSNDGEVETLQAILAAAGHGGNAAVVQGSVGLDGATDELAASGDIALEARAFDLTDSARGIQVTALSDAVGAGMQMVHVGHQAEVYGAKAGKGQDLNGQNADSNGIGGDGGDAIVDQYALNGGVQLLSDHEILVSAQDVSPAAHEVRAFVGHRLTIGSDHTAYRNDPIVRAGDGGSESGDVFDDGRAGNGGDVFITQRGVISGSARPGDAGDYNTEIQLVAMEDSDNDTSITIEALALGPAAPDVETHIGHDMLIASARAGDAGMQGALTGPQGAEGLLEANGGDIFINQTDLGADIDIAGRDAVNITSQGVLGNWAHLLVGHERTVGESSDSDSPRSGNIMAGLGGDDDAEDMNITARASMEAAANGVIEDADSGGIYMTLGRITGSEDGNSRFVTVTSTTENVTVESDAATGATALLEIGNQQQAIGETQEASDFRGVPLTQIAGDSGNIRIARDTIDGDILIQALDADRASSADPSAGKIVSITSTSAAGATAETQIGHETEFTMSTGRSGFGIDANFLTETNLANFVALPDAGTDADGEATWRDALNAVTDMRNVLNVLRMAYGNADRFPADDGAADLNDRGDMMAIIQDVEQKLADAEAAIAAVDSEAGRAGAINTVQGIAETVIAQVDNFQTILGTIPEAGEQFADHAAAGGVFYENISGQGNFDIDALRTIENTGYAGNLVMENVAVNDTGVVTGNVDILSGHYNGSGNVNNVANDDSVVANVFTDSGNVDNLDDSAVVITSTSDSFALTEIGHRRTMVNTTAKGGGDTNAAPEEGGVAGDGGSITTRNITSGDVNVAAEEVVIHADGAAGQSEVHLLHSSDTQNLATGWSDIQTLLGSGGDISNETAVSGGVTVTADRVASALDAQDRVLGTSGAADTFLHLGHQVSDVNRSNSDPVETGNVGDTQDNLGSNRGGDIVSSQSVGGDANGDLVTIALNPNSDLLIQTGGVGATGDIRLGNGEFDANRMSESVFHSGISGKDVDDGGVVTLTQSVGGNINISNVEDLEINAFGATDNDIYIGHNAEQYGRSGEVNSADTPQYGERVTVTQAVAGNLNVDARSSFTAHIDATTTGDLRFGHDALQEGYSADDSGDPSDYEAGNSASQAGINDSFARPDVLATQTVDAGIAITSGEITLLNEGAGDLRFGHDVTQRAAVDGDLDGADGTPSGYVVATSVINGEGDDIVFTATGASGQRDSVVAPINGTEGDITLEVADAGGVYVGHSSTSEMTDGEPIAEGHYQTLQAIGSYTDADGDGQVDDTSNSVIRFTSAQDIEVLGANGVAQIGHFIQEIGDLQMSPAYADSTLTQVVGSDLVFGEVTPATDPNIAGSGANGVGNNLIITSDSGRAMIGHMSPDSNMWQVEGSRAVTRQLLDGDITIEVGTDSGSDVANGMIAAAGDESGSGDDLLIETVSGVAGIGHNQANVADSGDMASANETQASAGDIWVRAGGDLHVTAGHIGHENYDFDSTAVSSTNALPGSGIRNRIAGDVTIGAAQNTWDENTLRTPDVLRLDGSAQPVRINSGYGGRGGRDLNGHLRFFIPAQENLTIISTVTFNDSDSSGDKTYDRTNNDGNVFEEQGGNDHQHLFEVMSIGATYEDDVIGDGNFAFYFERPVMRATDEFTPNFYNPSGSFSISYGSGASIGSPAVNSGSLSGGAGAYSGSASCDTKAALAVITQESLSVARAQSCVGTELRYRGIETGFGELGFRPERGGSYLDNVDAFPVELQPDGKNPRLLEIDAATVDNISRNEAEGSAPATAGQADAGAATEEQSLAALIGEKARRGMSKLIGFMAR